MTEAPSTQRPDPWRWLAQRKSSALPATVPEPPEKVDLKKSLVPAHQPVSIEDLVLPPPPGESESVQTSVLPKPPKNFVLDGRKILGISGNSVILDDGKLVSRNTQYIQNLRRAGYTEITADQVKSLSKQGRAPYPIAGPYYPPALGSEAEKTGQTVLSRVAEFASTPLVPLKKAAERILSTAEAEPPRDVYVRGRLIKQAKPGLTAFERGFIKGTAGFLEGLTTPVNLALLATIPLTAGVPVLGGLISAGFSADMIFGKGGLIDKSPEFVRQVKSGDVEGAVELGVEMAGTTAFATGAGKHAASRWKSDFQRSLAKKTARAKADELVKQFEKAPPRAYEMTVADLLAERQPKPPVPEVKPTGEKRAIPESPPILLPGKPKTPEDLRMIQGKPGSPDDLRMIEGKAKRPEELELERLEERAKRVRDELEREREQRPAVIDRRRVFEGAEDQVPAAKQIAQPAPTATRESPPPAIPETPVVEKTIRPRTGLSIQAARARQYDEGTIERFIVENGGMRPSRDMVEGAKGRMPEEFRYMLRQRPGAKSDASAADYLDPVYSPKSPYTPDQMVQSMKSEGLVPESFTENDLYQVLSGRKVGTRGTNFPGHERQEKIDALEREFEQMTEQEWDALTEKQRTRVIDEIEKLESEIPDEVETKNFGELINFLEEVGTKHERTIAGQLEKPTPEVPKSEGGLGGDAPGPAAERVPAGPSRGPIATEQLATETEAFLKENARQQAAQEANLLSLEMKQKSREPLAGELPIEESPLFGGPRQQMLTERPPEIYSEKLHQAIILADENRFYDALSYFRPEDRARVDGRILEAGAGPEAVRQVIREEARALIELPPPPPEGRVTPSAIEAPSARGNQIKVEILEKTKIPTEQVDAWVSLLESHARGLGLTLDEWMDRRIAGVSGEKPGEGLFQRAGLTYAEFERVAEQAAPAIKGTVNRIVHSPEISEEIAQEATLRAWTDRHTMKDAKHLERFLHLTAKRLAIDWSRRFAQKKRAYPENLEAVAGYAPSHVDKNIYVSELRSVLGPEVEKLPAELREAVLTMAEEKNARETARRLGIPFTTLHSRRERGLQEIRRVLTEKGLEDQLFQGEKGAVQFLKDGRAILHVFQSADVSTLIHEAAHIFRRELPREDLQAVESWLRIDKHKWAEADEEKFAGAVERYLRDGVQPQDARLRQVFERFKEWLRTIYQTIAGSPLDVEINPEVRRVMDRMLGAEPVSKLPPIPPPPSLRELRPGEAGFLRIDFGDRGKSQKAEDIVRRAEEDAAKREAKGLKIEDKREYLERELPPPPGERTQIPDVPPPPSEPDPLADVRDPLTRAIARDYTENKGLFAETETKLPSGSSVSHPGPGKASTKPPKDLNVIKANILSAHSILRGNPHTQPVYETIITAENAKNRDMIHFFNLIYGNILKGFKPKSDEAISLVNVLEGKIMPELIKGDRNKVLDAARRLRTEVYDPLFERAKTSVPEVLNERYVELLRKKSTLQKSMRPNLPDRELLRIKERLRLVELELERTPRTRPIRYIKHYFTHIAQRQFGGMLPADVREFASDRFISRFLKAREEDAPYDLDIFEVMRVYIPSVMKSIHDVPAVERARKMVEEIPREKKGDEVIADYFQNLRSYANSYLDNYLGKTDIQRSEIAQAEVKLARAVASYYYRLLLGWNPFSAAINLTQTGLNTFPLLGTRYTLEGIRRLSTPNGRKEVAESGLFLDYPLLAEEASRATGTGKVRDLLGPMRMFNTAEFWNRGVAYLGAKAKGRNLGLKGTELENYALDIVDRTQFRYTRADAIRGLQQSGPLGAAAPVIGQFKTYPMKQAEFIWNEIIGNLRSEPVRALRFMVAATVLGMPVLEFLPYDMVAPFEKDLNFLLQVVQGKKKITAEELAKRVPGLRQLITIPQKIERMER